MEGAGQQLPYTDLPGRVMAPNLTPDKESGAGSWSDDMFARAIREGIGHDGRALFPIMPYSHYRNLPDETWRQSCLSAFPSSREQPAAAD